MNNEQLPELIKPKRVVVCAAIRSQNTGQIVTGARHFDDIMRKIVFQNGKRDGDWLSADQGFIDQFGVFMDRQEAYRIAKENGQLLERRYDYGPTLYSEDLY